jgi:hypothetical protein
MLLRQVRCTANGVTMADVQDVLDARASKVTRRPGNAKPAFILNPTAKPFTNGVSSDQTSRSATPLAKPSGPVASLEATTTPLPAAQADIAPVSEAKATDKEIIPPVYDLAALSTQQRATLLKRPLIESKEMLAKVEPILNKVYVCLAVCLSLLTFRCSRSGGDSALRSFVSQLDRCTAASNSEWPLVISAPFDSSLMQLSDETKKAIDTAFANIHLFHSKQVCMGPICSFCSSCRLHTDGERSASPQSVDYARHRMHSFCPCHLSSWPLHPRRDGCPSFYCADALHPGFHRWMQFYHCRNTCRLGGSCQTRDCLYSCKMRS